MTRSSRRSPFARLAGIAAVAGAFSGCGGATESTVPLHPAGGKVLAGGKPLAGVRVVLRPSGAERPEGGPVPIGATDAEGAFRLATAADEGRLADGAPEGDYDVAISMLARSDSADFLGKGPPKTPDFSLPPAYSDPKTSGLKATIKAGENTIGPFDLKSAGAGAPRPASESNADGRSR